MTPEELDKAISDEAWRLLEEGQDVAVIAARLARENWRPVDPDMLAYREWAVSQPCSPDYREAVLEGKWDLGVSASGFLAGARMAREQEQERAKGLVDALEKIFKYSRNFENLAGPALAAYKAGRAAR